MEWIKNLLAKHTKDEKLSTEAFLTELNTEFPKNAVPKDKYNELAETRKNLETDIKARDTQLGPGLMCGPFHLGLVGLGPSTLGIRLS